MQIAPHDRRGSRDERGVQLERGQEHPGSGGVPLLVEPRPGDLPAIVVQGDLGLQRLGPEAVTAFVLDMRGKYSTGSMKHATSGLRSLLRFLFTVGDINRDLSSAVPSVAGWRLAGLPVGADEDTVTALLACCFAFHARRNGSINAHCGSVRSVEYALRSMTQGIRTTGTLGISTAAMFTTTSDDVTPKKSLKIS